jgi:uncharacterized repeat protein (TIGR02543 family)
MDRPTIKGGTMKNTKVLKYLAAAAVVSFLLCLSRTASAEDPVRFRDTNLKAAVEAALGKSSPTPTDMLGLIRLDAPEAGISDLTGLADAINLAELNLWSNDISDLSALTGLTHLTALQLQRNPLSDDACGAQIRQIRTNNPGIDLTYDPCVYRCTLTISSTEGGSVTSPGSGSFEYDSGTVVPVVAEAQSGWHFAGWTGTAAEAHQVADAALASTTVTMDDNYTLRANFESNQHTLTILCGPEGSVTTDILSTVSAQTLAGAGSFVFDHGTELKVTVTGNGDWQFTGWTGTMASNQNPLVFTLTSDERIEAHFALNAKTLIITASEGGTVTRPGVGSFAFEQGVAIPVEATPDPDYRFIGWTGTVVDRKDIADSRSSVTSVTLNEGGTLQANFEPIREFLESWEIAAAGRYEPLKARFIYADEGDWSVTDAVSQTRECGPTPQQAEVLKLDSGQALLLTSTNSNSTCSDIVSVSLVEAGLVNPGFALPIDANTMLSFYEIGQLDRPGLHGSGQDCLIPPCFDNVSLLLTDNRGNVLVYVLQRPTDAVANTPNVNFRGTYGEIFLDPTGIYYRRDLLSDFRTIPAFNPVDAEVRSVEFRVDQHGSAMIDDITIHPGVIDGSVPVYRFWSPVLESYFFTTGVAERQAMLDLFSSVWTFEGIAYFTAGDGNDPNGGENDPNAAPVYRFWSPVLGSHFYTINEDEKEVLARDFSPIWQLEGIAFYAYPEGRQPADSCPVYRFWSGALGRHFYTTSEQERDDLVHSSSDVWTLEGVAWYVYPAPWDSSQALQIMRDRQKAGTTK